MANRDEPTPILALAPTVRKGSDIEVIYVVKVVVEGSREVEEMQLDDGVDEVKAIVESGREFEDEEVDAYARSVNRIKVSSQHL